MAKFVPQPDKHTSPDFALGQATVKQLHDAIAAGDYAKIAIAVGRDQAHLSEDIRAEIKTAHEAFLTTVWNFIVEGVPDPDTWQTKKGLTLKEAEKAIRSLDDITSELAKIAAHQIIPQTRLIGLQTLIARSQRAVHSLALKHGDSIRRELTDKIDALTESTNDAIDVGVNYHDYGLLTSLSQQVIDVYNLSCLIEDSIPGWHLGKKNRQPLRIIAKRLTNEVGLATHLQIRPVTNPSGDNQRRRDNPGRA
jgi:hypothetical protein